MLVRQGFQECILDKTLTPGYAALYCAAIKAGRMAGIMNRWHDYFAKI
jgi:hypothetical protein